MTMYKNVDGVQVEMSAEEEAQIIAEQSQWATEKAAVQYLSLIHISEPTRPY